MRIGLVMALLVSALFGAVAPKLSEKYEDSRKCKPCHADRVAEWENSWHANSHYGSDEYLRKSIDYVSRKSHRSVNSVKVQCAVCHNPRIAITETSTDYEIIAAMNMDEKSNVTKALNNSTLSEGINCLVCHNINKINDHLDEKERGVHRVEWNKVGTMSGPLNDAVSPYHNTQERDFFSNNPNKLCFVCHANDRSTGGLLITDMKSEFGKSKEKCVECHMSPKKEGVASNYPIDNGKPKQRMIREHNFAGGHVESMWAGALRVSLKRQGETLLVTLTNDQPHNLPSGFGARELIVEVDYTKGTDALKSQVMSLTQHYTDKRGRATIPHLAKNVSEDMSVPAHGSKTVKFNITPGTEKVWVNVYYRLVNDEVRELLKLEEPIWSKKMLINSATTSL